MPATFANPETIEQISEEHEQWTELLRSLDEPDWDRLSACEGWTIKHVVAHVVSGIEFYLQSLDNALAGSVEPLWPASGGRAGREAEFRRCLTYPNVRLIDEFDEAANLLAKKLMKVTEEDADLPAWHPSGIWTVDRMVGARLSDSSIHRWDIRTGLEPAPRFDDERLPFLVQYVCASATRYVDPAAGKGGNASWRFDLTAPVDRQVTIAVKEGQVGVSEGAGSEPPGTTCTADPNAFVLLMVGRLPLEGVEGAIASGGISNVRGREDGLPDLVARLRRI